MVRRRRTSSRKPPKPQQNIKAKRGTAAPRNRRVSASSKGRKVARLARKGDALGHVMVARAYPPRRWCYM
jgi:hypothetical protein